MDTPISAIGDIQVAIPVGLHAVRQIELPGFRAIGPPRLDPVAVLVVFGYPRVQVAIADEDVVVGVKLTVLPALDVFVVGVS